MQVGGKSGVCVNGVRRSVAEEEAGLMLAALGGSILFEASVDC